MSYRSRFAESSLLLLTAVLAPACGGGQSETPPPETAATAPPPVAEAPPPAPAASAPAPATAAPEPAASAAPAAPPAAPAEAEKAGMHHGHGMAAFIVAALGKVEVRPDQKAAIDAAVADLEKQGGAHADAGKQLASDIADGVAAGKIDHAKTDADVKKLVAAVEATKAGVQDDVNNLHKALDAAQRKQLVEAMRAKGEEMREKEGHEESEEHEHEGKMKMLSDTLGLTPEQTDKLKAKMKDVMKGQMATMKTNMGAMHKHMKEIADAFESDKFDAKKVGVGKNAPEMARTMAKHRIQFVETVLAVLTPEQRAKFAEHVREHAQDGG